MTTTTTDHPAHARTQAGGPHTGTLELVRHLLRRDRIKLPAWLAGIALYVLYIGTALPSIAPREQDLAAIIPMLQQPIGRMFTGPAYGLDDPSYERVFAGGYLLYLLILAALMNIMLITRHTRAEEQSGRAELLRANGVGRQAPLTAALGLAALTNLLAGVIVAVLCITVADYAVTGSLIVGAGVALIGMSFAGLTAVTVQLSGFSRAAAGLAGLVLGASFLLRAVGDMAAIGGSAASWASPLGWVNQTAPYVLDRWWPLLLLVAVTVITVPLAFVLQGRRDLGAGLLSTRPGRPEAGPTLGSAWGLAARLQRGPALAWGLALIVLGLTEGLFTQVMIDSTFELPDALRDVFGTDALTQGYIAFLALFTAMMTSAYVVYAAQGLRSEERSARGDAVLATPTSRASWAGAHLGVIALAASLIMAVGGLLTGLGVWLVTSDTGLFTDTVVAHLNLLPAVLLVVGTCALLFGWAPSLLAPVGWTLVAVMIFVGNFAAMLDLPDWLNRLSPLDYPAQFPVEEIDWLPLGILLLLSVGAVALGLLGLRRREIAGR